MKFFKTTLNYLGYTLMPEGIKPQTKKVEAIQHILQPTSQKQLRCFLGMVNYYHNMWHRCSYILALLATLAGKNAKKFIWTKKYSDIFEEVK